MATTDKMHKGTKPTPPLAKVTHSWGNDRSIVECELIGSGGDDLFLQIRVNGHSIAVNKAQWSRVRVHGDDWLGDFSL